MPRLIAKRPILHLATQYKAGEELPQNDQTMVKLWLEYDSATYEANEGKQVNSQEEQKEECGEVEPKEDKKTEKKSTKSKKEAQ